MRYIIKIRYGARKAGVLSTFKTIPGGVYEYEKFKTVYKGIQGLGIARRYPVGSMRVDRL